LSRQSKLTETTETTETLPIRQMKQTMSRLNWHQRLRRRPQLRNHKRGLEAGRYSTIIGVLLDGFSMYGSKGEGGVMLINADLDECSDHVGLTPGALRGSVTIS
jgi:hypothetical protein